MDECPKIGPFLFPRDLFLDTNYVLSSDILLWHLRTRGGVGVQKVQGRGMAEMERKLYYLHLWDCACSRERELPSDMDSDR